jgi:predicted signal transduction protein with EAL and GGDEF domain
VQGSIGIALFPSDSTQPNHLVEQADAAMYLAKQEGKNQVRFYTGTLARNVARQFAMELDLRQSFSVGGLELHFMPGIGVATGRLSGVEALVRWEHPQRGPVPPAEFVLLAEERGLIVQLGRWVLDAACRQISRWRDAGLRPPRCAINLSAHQLVSDALFDDMCHALERHGLEGSAIELELTEAVITAQRMTRSALRSTDVGPRCRTCSTQASASQIRPATQINAKLKGPSTSHPFRAAKVSPVGKVRIIAVRGAISTCARTCAAATRAAADCFELVRMVEL